MVIKGMEKTKQSQTKQKLSIYDVILVGMGPSCISAAIYLARTGKKIFLIGEKLGGLVANANLIENLLGFPDGITGNDFLDLMMKSIAKLKIPFAISRVERINRKEDVFEIKTEQKTFRSNILIIGTGTIPNKLGISGEKEAFEAGRLFYEIYNLTLDSSKETIAIIGSGDAAFDYGLNLINKVSRIDLIQRSLNSKALQVLQQSALKKKNFNILRENEISQIKNSKTSFELVIKTKNEIFSKHYDKVLVAVGRRPNIEFLSEDLLKLYNHKIKTPFIYFVGDLINQKFRQISIAMGDGVKAAMEIESYSQK